MKKNIKILIIGLLLALVVFSALLAAEYNIMKKYKQTEVLVAAGSIKQGTLITDDNVKKYFKTILVSDELKTSSVLTDAEKTSGKLAVCNIAEGSIIYKENFKNEERIAGIDNPAELSVSLNNFSDGVSGTLRKGDYVCMYGKDENTQNTKAGYYYIKDAFTSAGEKIQPGDTASVASVFTLIVEESEYESVCQFIKNNDIMLVKINK